MRARGMQAAIDRFMNSNRATALAVVLVLIGLSALCVIFLRAN